MAWPPFVTWAEGLSTETVGEDLFSAKNRTKFEWRRFFLVGLHLILGRKRTWFGAEKFSFWSSLLSNFLPPPPPPLFQNPAYATGLTPTILVTLFKWIIGRKCPKFWWIKWLQKPSKLKNFLTQQLQFVSTYLKFHKFFKEFYPPPQKRTKEKGFLPSVCKIWLKKVIINKPQLLYITHKSKQIFIILPALRNWEQNVFMSYTVYSWTGRKLILRLLGQKLDFRITNC